MRREGEKGGWEGRVRREGEWERMGRTGEVVGGAEGREGKFMVEK